MAGMMIRTGGSDPGSATLRKTSALIQRSAWLSTLAASAGAALRELTDRLGHDSERAAMITPGFDALTCAPSRTRICGLLLGRQASTVAGHG